jgi:hypothetical protein
MGAQMIEWLIWGALIAYVVWRARHVIQRASR